MIARYLLYSLLDNLFLFFANLGENKLSSHDLDVTDTRKNRREKKKGVLLTGSITTFKTTPHLLLPFFKSLISHIFEQVFTRKIRVH